MTSKKIVSVNFQFPSDGVENLSTSACSNNSILDADILIFSPRLPIVFSSLFGYQKYNGKYLIDKNESVNLIRDLNYWKNELDTFICSNKTVIIFLSELEEIMYYTERTNVHGNGRNRSFENLVDSVSNYNLIPLEFGNIVSRNGKEIKVNKDLGVLSSYWKEFGKYSTYNTYLENSKFKPILTTKVGEKIVGSIFMDKGRKVIILPKISVRKENKKEFWNSFKNSILNLDSIMSSSSSKTLPPIWLENDSYISKKEKKIKEEINKSQKIITDTKEKIDSLKEKLEKESMLKDLLFENGTLLEHVIIESLKILGFEAENYTDKESEFDVIFKSKEGRFIGEIEGKDRRFIDIDKHSQLERNINEDFEKDNVDDHAKGVLFGNACRLRPIKERDDFFTRKCVSASKRVKTALIRTPDIFKVVNYIKETGDSSYSKKCREEILKTEGKIVEFPKLPSKK